MNVVQDTAIVFRFTDAGSCAKAFDMLEELGYEPSFLGEERTRLHIHVDETYLTSALEIAQAYGGSLEERALISEAELTNLAYRLDMIPIPAHIVNEDWTDSYANALHEPGEGDDLALRDEEMRGWYDEPYDHFSGEVKT